MKFAFAMIVMVMVLVAGCGSDHVAKPKDKNMGSVDNGKDSSNTVDSVADQTTTDVEQGISEIDNVDEDLNMSDLDLLDEELSELENLTV